MAAVTICSDFGAQKNKVWHCFHCFPSISHEVMGPDAVIFVFWMLSFKPTFSLSTFTFIKRLLSSSSLSAIRVVSSAYLRLFIFLPAILIPVVFLPVQRFSWCTLRKFISVHKSSVALISKSSENSWKDWEGGERGSVCRGQGFAGTKDHYILVCRGKNDQWNISPPRVGRIKQIPGSASLSLVCKGTCRLQIEIVWRWPFPQWFSTQQAGYNQVGRY